MLGSARDRFRVEYSKSEDFNTAREVFISAIESGEFDGSYYKVIGKAKLLPDGRVEIRTNSHDSALQVGVMRFKLATGESEIEWFNSDPD